MFLELVIYGVNSNSTFEIDRDASREIFYDATVKILF